MDFKYKKHDNKSKQKIVDTETPEKSWSPGRGSSGSLYKTNKMHPGICCSSLAVKYYPRRKKTNIERVQKSAFHIILGNSYQSYENALELLGMETLNLRRRRLTYKFALRSEKNEKFKSWFKPAKKTLNTRTTINKYCDVKANHKRFMNSPIPYLTRLLNWHHNKQ